MTPQRLFYLSTCLHLEHIHWHTVHKVPVWLQELYMENFHNSGSVFHMTALWCAKQIRTHTQTNICSAWGCCQTVSGISSDPYLTVLCTLPAPSSDTISKYLLQESISSFCVEHSGPIQRHYWDWPSPHKGKSATLLEIHSETDRWCQWNILK